MPLLPSIIRNWRRNDALPTDSISDIIGSAAADEGIEIAPGPIYPTAADLAERVDLLIADFGRWTEYKAASTEYISEFTTEIRWHRHIRLAVVIACAILVVCFGILLVYCLKNATVIFGPNPGTGLTALIAGTIGGSVIIAIAAIKGAFSVMKDRNEGLPMPDHFKELYDATKNIFSKS